MRQISQDDIFQGQRGGTSPYPPPGSACRPFLSSPQPPWPVPGWAWSLQAEKGKGMQGECGKQESRAWARRAENKGRVSSGLRMMENPDSSGWLQGPVTSLAFLHPCPSFIPRSFYLAPKHEVLFSPAYMPSSNGLAPPLKLPPDL